MIWVEKQNSVEQNHSNLSMNLGKRNSINSHSLPDKNTSEDGFYGQRLGVLGTVASPQLLPMYLLHSPQGKAWARPFYRMLLDLYLPDFSIGKRCRLLAPVQ